MELKARMAASAAVARRTAAEGMVLLKNEGHLLPLHDGTKLAVFGIGQIHTIKGGTGSGEVNNLKSVNILEGLEGCESLKVDEDVAAVYRKWAETHGIVKQGFFAGPGEQKNYNDETPIDPSAIKTAAGKNDAAVVVVSRIAGEGQDMEAKPGTIMLTAEESALIDAVAAEFGKVILLLNVPGYMDITAKMDKLTSVLFIGLPGQEGGCAVADILTGTVPVSGKLTDTWPLSFDDDPTKDYYSKLIPNGNKTFNRFMGGETDQTDVPYHDDIYVGYRYYDTYGKKVLFPFGFGLSYGHPEITCADVALEGADIVVTAKVENKCRHHSVREVVQVYVSAPDGKLEKPYQELKGYKKTGVLGVGGEEFVTIHIPVANLASYDEATASYILEPGKYYVRVGNSSRNTHIAAALEVESEITTRKLKNLLGTTPEGYEKLTKKGQTPISYEGEEAEKAAAKVLTVCPKAIKCETVEYGKYDYVPGTAKPGITLKDVAEGKATVEDLAATMDLEDLCRFVCGQGMDFSGFEGIMPPPPPAGAKKDDEKKDDDDDVFASLVSHGNAQQLKFEVPGEAGQSPDMWEKYKLPPIILCDGPAGVRITRDVKENGEVVRHQYCTAFPTGSLLASSWDDEVLEAVGHAAGVEMDEYKVDLWLAPGMNIHRSPLCGRNFEYYAEDPVVAGRSAAAMTKGVQAEGGGVTIKHFAGNSQEFMRGNSSNTVSERAMREIYLAGFEYCVKTEKPKSLMTSYNDTNGVPNADNYDLVTAILRDEWGFDGFVMTDWGGGISTPMVSMWAGNDMIQPGGKPVSDGIQKAVESGEPVVSKGLAKVTITPTRAMVEKSAAAIMRVILRSSCFTKHC